MQSINLYYDSYLLCLQISSSPLIIFFERTTKNCNKGFFFFFAAASASPFNLTFQKFPIKPENSNLLCIVTPTILNSYDSWTLQNECCISIAYVSETDTYTTLADKYQTRQNRV